MASQLEKERNRISLKRQSNIQKSLSNPVSPTESTMQRRKSSVISHKRSSRTSTVSRGRSSIIGGKRVSVMDPTIDLDLENNPRLMESRPSKTEKEPQKPTGRTSRSSKLSKDSVASVVQPYQYTPDSSDQTLVRMARYRHGFFIKYLYDFQYNLLKSEFNENLNQYDSWVRRCKWYALWTSKRRFRVLTILTTSRMENPLLTLYIRIDLTYNVFLAMIFSC